MEFKLYDDLTSWDCDSICRLCRFAEAAWPSTDCNGSACSQSLFFHSHSKHSNQRASNEHWIVLTQTTRVTRESCGVCCFKLEYSSDEIITTNFNTFGAIDAFDSIWMNCPNNYEGVFTILYGGKPSTNRSHLNAKNISFFFTQKPINNKRYDLYRTWINKMWRKRKRNICSLGPHTDRHQYNHNPSQSNCGNAYTSHLDEILFQDKNRLLFALAKWLICQCVCLYAHL